MTNNLSPSTNVETAASALVTVSLPVPGRTEVAGSDEGLALGRVVVTRTVGATVGGAAVGGILSGPWGGAVSGSAVGASDTGGEATPGL